MEYHDVISANFSSSVSASIFPNPSNGKSLFIVAGFEPGVVSVFNLSGKEIHKSILTAGKNEINFAQTLDRGFYLVTVKQGSTEQKLKLQVN